MQVVPTRAPGAELAPSEATSSPRPVPSGRRSWTARLAPAALLTALTGASALSRLDGMRAWYWVDEGLSLGISSHRLTAIPGVLRQDGSPPLYYLLLHVWTGLFGRTEAATHALSLLLALACVPVAWWAGQSLFGRRVGWAFAVLAATNPFLTYYGRETRMYTLVALLALVATAGFLHAFAFGRRRHLVTFSAALTLLLYTHLWAVYFTLTALMALAFCALVAPDRRRVARDGVLAFGAAAVLFAPWLPTLLFQVRHTGAPWSSVPTLREAISEVDAVLGDERVLVALLLVGVSGLWTVVRPPERPFRWSPAAVAVVVAAAFFVVPVAVAWTLSQVQPSWATRYLALVVGPVLLLAALGLGRAGWQGVAALVLIILFWTHPLGRLTGDRDRVPMNEKSNVREVAAQLGPHLGRGDVVVSSQPEQVPLLHHYFPSGLRFADPMGQVADPAVMDWRDALARLKASTPATGLLPLVDRLPRGGHVLLLVPLVPLNSRDSEWVRLFHLRALQWEAALSKDPRFQLVTTAGRFGPVTGGTALRGLLYAKG